MLNPFGNRTEYESYLSDTLFCNDRTISSYIPSGYLNTGIGTDATAYRWFYEPEDGNYPRLTCQEQNDRFTVNDTTLGNGALTYPIGLITIDEAYLAGGYGTNYKYYLYTGYSYWTLSPYSFDGLYAVVREMDSYGQVTYKNNTYSTQGVRPVLNLSSGLLKKGTGMWNDPYMVG